MKREGRQRGLVRTHCTSPHSSNIKPNQNLTNPPTAGIFTKVGSKPTSHSKFTGKCARPRCSECHLQPAWRSKDKAKGAQKIRSSDRALDHGESMAWRVGGSNCRIRGSNKLRLEKHSASRIVAELTSEFYHLQADDNDYDDENDDDVDDANGAKDLVRDSYHGDQMVPFGEGDGDPQDHELKNNSTGFFDVATVWEPVEKDDGWFLVGEVSMS